MNHNIEHRSRLHGCKAITAALLVLAGLHACSGSNTATDSTNAPAVASPVDAATPSDAPTDADAGAYSPDRFITRVVSFTPGPVPDHYGQDQMPEIVYGPPVGGGACMGSLDVVSLGAGGEIVVEFVNNAVVDGPGPDLLVFANPFIVGCTDPSKVYAKPAEISVSDDGVTWATFPCTATSYPFGSCAGWHVVYSTPTNGISPLDPAVAGGDPFDLADVGVKHAKYVRVRDMKSMVDAHGFNLDAMAIVNAEKP